jgi:hypothetical protein
MVDVYLLLIVLYKKNLCVWMGGCTVAKSELNVSEMVAFVLAAMDVVAQAGHIPYSFEKFSKGIKLILLFHHFFFVFLFFCSFFFAFY